MENTDTAKPATEKKTSTRRTLIKGAAWATPTAIAVTAAPALAASTTLEGISVTGSCGGLGLIGQGFEIIAPTSAPIPAGSVLTIERSTAVGAGVLNLNLEGFDNLVSVDLVNGRTSRVIFNEKWTGTGLVGAVVTVNVGVEITASLTVPSPYELGPNSKGTGSISQLLGPLCTDT